MAMPSESPLIIPPTGRHTATVIFAHGLGGSGHRWAPRVDNWRRSGGLNEVKFVLPHAPQISVSRFMGARMPAWFNVHAGGLTAPARGFRPQVDEAGMMTSQQYFHVLIQAEIDSGIPADRIIIGGFSQGGAISLFAGLTVSFKLGGVVALGCAMPLWRSFVDVLPRPTASVETPIFMGHGTEDQIVRPMAGRMSCSGLQAIGFSVTWKEYQGLGHVVSPEMLDDVRRFLLERIPMG